MTKKFHLLLLLWCVSNAVALAEDSELQTGKKMFEAHCLVCHSGAIPEAPKVEALKLYPPERIVESLNSGIMSVQALMLSNQDMRDVAYYLTGKRVEPKKPVVVQNMCGEDLPIDHQARTAGWASWGGPAGNQRYQSTEAALNSANVAGLELKWAFGFNATTRVRSQPTVSGNTVYIGSQEGTVYALDIESGCVHWTFKADAEVRGAIAYLAESGDRSSVLLFGDFKANAYSIDAATGELLWKTKVHEHPLATITGSVVADEQRVYVPVSSSEVVPAARSDYPCCTFRGALVAVNLADGSKAWRTDTTPEPKKLGKNSVGADWFGPSGAPIWSSPTLDHKRGVVMVTTGQNYSSPATGTSDAVIAMDTADGKIRWVSQVWENDAWNGGCSRKTANCPKENGPDFDIGASVVMVKTKGGKELLFAGQKSGIVYALDPDQEGKILWQKRVGRGGTMGGVHWGMSSDGERLYVGISDLPTNNPYAEGDPQPGLHALDPANGEFIWRRLFSNTCPSGLKFMCFQGISAAVSSSPGLLFSGGLDGKLRAVDSGNGKVLWEHNTHRSYTTVNGVEGFGGAIESDGPVVVNGRVLVTSGYDKWGEMPGNVLLVFSLPESKSK